MICDACANYRQIHMCAKRRRFWKGNEGKTNIKRVERGIERKRETEIDSETQIIMTEWQTDVLIDDDRMLPKFIRFFFCSFLFSNYFLCCAWSVHGILQNYCNMHAKTMQSASSICLSKVIHVMFVYLYLNRKLTKVVMNILCQLNMHDVLQQNPGKFNHFLYMLNLVMWWLESNQYFIDLHPTLTI